MTTGLIAVVDDDPSARQAITGLLRALGHDAAEFTCAEDVLAWEGLSGIACLVADFRMPGLDGIELHRLLVERGASIPMIIMTAFPDRVSRERANALGVVGYLAKPVSPDELLGCLRAALGGSVGGGEASDPPDQGGPHE